MSQKTIRPFHIFKNFEMLFKSNWLHETSKGTRKRGVIWEGPRNI